MVGYLFSYFISSFSPFLYCVANSYRCKIEKKSKVDIESFIFYTDSSNYIKLIL